MKIFAGDKTTLQTYTHLICSRYCAQCIWSLVPTIVMIRSSDPSSGSAMDTDARDCWRISLILCPPFPMISPASWNTPVKYILAIYRKHTENSYHVFNRNEHEQQKQFWNAFMLFFYDEMQMPHQIKLHVTGWLLTSRGTLTCDVFVWLRPP